MKKLLAIVFTLCLITVFAAGCGGSQGSDASSDSAADSAYIAIVTDGEDAPVEGAVLQLCSDIACEQQTTDGTGTAVFTSEPGVYTLKVYKVPEGYAEDHTEYEVPENYALIPVVLSRSDQAE